MSQRIRILLWVMTSTKTPELGVIRSGLRSWRLMLSGSQLTGLWTRASSSLRLLEVMGVGLVLVTVEGLDLRLSIRVFRLARLLSPLRELTLLAVPWVSMGVPKDSEKAVVAGGIRGRWNEPGSWGPHGSALDQSV